MMYTKFHGSQSLILEKIFEGFIIYGYTKFHGSQALILEKIFEGFTVYGYGLVHMTITSICMTPGGFLSNFGSNQP